MPSSKVTIRCTVNGAKVAFQAYPLARLLDVLRDELKLTGTKEGCGEGECGACAVFVDGKLVNSCLIPVGQLNGANIVTIEGVAQGASLNGVQKAFLEKGAVQCGMCTPGMVMAAVGLLKANPRPNEKEIREGLSGNLCRCTGYQKIVQSVAEASGLERKT